MRFSGAGSWSSSKLLPKPKQKLLWNLLPQLSDPRHRHPDHISGEFYKRKEGRREEGGGLRSERVLWWP